MLSSGNDSGQRLPRHVRVPLLVGLGSALMLLGGAAVTAPAVGLLRSGQRTVGTVESVSHADVGSSEGRPMVHFEHADGRPRRFRASNPFGHRYEKGESFDVVYDPEACTATRCEGLGVVAGEALLRLQIILGVAIGVFFVAAPIVTAVVLRRSTTPA